MFHLNVLDDDQEHSQVELELRILEALEIYPLAKLQGLLILLLLLIPYVSSLFIQFIRGN